MAHTGYDPEYAGARVAAIDGQIAENKAEAKRLTELRKRYAVDAPKKTTD